MRVSDVFLAVPQVVLAIAIAQTLGPSLPNVNLSHCRHVLAVVRPRVYAENGALQQEVFVESTAALGASPWRLDGAARAPKHRLPVIVRASIGMGFTILTAAALGFLGLGPATAPRPSGAARSRSRASSCPTRGGTPRRRASPSSSPSWASTCSATGCATS